jgi:HSP20 family protein
MSQPGNALVKHNGGGALPGDFLRGPLTVPAVDIAETADAYVLSLDMPGAVKDAISVTVLGDTLAVRGAIRTGPGPGSSVLYSEIPAGVYERRFSLGRGIDRMNVDAGYRDGVLTVRLLKTVPSGPGTITIR